MFSFPDVSVCPRWLIDDGISRWRYNRGVAAWFLIHELRERWRAVALLPPKNIPTICLTSNHKSLSKWLLWKYQQFVPQNWGNCHWGNLNAAKLFLSQVLLICQLMAASGSVDVTHCAVGAIMVHTRRVVLIRDQVIWSAEACNRVN